MKAHSLAEEAAMDTLFVARLPKWAIALFGRNSLVRTSDWVEALVLVLTVFVSLLAVPIACAVGTAVHDSHQQLYAEQAQTRHIVTATVTDDNAAQQYSPTNMITVRDRRSGAGVNNAGHQDSPTNMPAVRDLWSGAGVNYDGSPADTPTSSTRAAVDAVRAAVATWLTVTTAAAVPLALTRVVLKRVRNKAWQLGIDNLVGGDGHTRHP